MYASRRSFLKAGAGAAALFPGLLSSSTLAKGAEPDGDEADVALPKWPLSPNGRKFQLQMFGELIHFQMFSPPQVSDGWAMAASEAVKHCAFNSLCPWNGRKRIEKNLNLSSADMETLRVEPSRVWTADEWRARAAELTPEDATEIYLRGSKEHHVPALLALARSNHIDAIANYKLAHTPAPRPGEKPYDIKGALGLYADPDGKYGLGGSEAEQALARDFLFMVRNHGPLQQPDIAARLLPPAYAAPLVQEIVDNTRARSALHVPGLERSKYAQAIQILQHEFPREITEEQMRQAQAEVMSDKPKPAKRPAASKDAVKGATQNPPASKATTPQLQRR